MRYTKLNTKLNPALIGCMLYLAAASALAGETPVASATAKTRPAPSKSAYALACPQEKFRGKGGKARLRTCVEAYQKQRQSEEQQNRAEIETWRSELRERCAQDPHSCDARKAELDEKLRNVWRDQSGEGQSAD